MTASAGENTDIGNPAPRGAGRSHHRRERTVSIIDDAAIATIVANGDLDAREALDAELDEASDDDPAPAVPTKRAKAEKKAARAGETTARKVERLQAERERIRALVPWKLVEVTTWDLEQGRLYGYNQRGEIVQYFDDHGKHPARFRAYAREEWLQAIAVLADSIDGLVETHPEYQQRAGVYVEERGEDLLLVRAKHWTLQILVPAKGTLKGKTFELRAAPGKEEFGGEDKRADQLTELLTAYLPAGARDVLLDICCQYLRPVRIRINRAVWQQEHPELAQYADVER